MSTHSKIVRILAVMAVVVLGHGPTAMAGLNDVYWSPTNLASTVVWLDASDAGTLWADTGGTTTATTTVARWDDKSGNTNHAVQGTGSIQPSTATEAIGGLNTVSFYSGDILQTTNNPFAPTISHAFVIAVYKLRETGQGGLFSLTGTGNVANRWNAHAPWPDGNMYFDVGGATGNKRISAAFGASNGDDIIASFYASTSDSAKHVYKNGSLLVSNSVAVDVNTVGNLAVGSSTVETQRAGIGEFIVIDGTVDLDTRQLVEGYLAWKWELVDKLPVDHPYKLEPPNNPQGGTLFIFE